MAIQVALANFEAQLDEAQKLRFDTLIVIDGGLSLWIVSNNSGNFATLAAIRRASSLEGGNKAKDYAFI